MGTFLINHSDGIFFGLLLIILFIKYWHKKRLLDGLMANEVEQCKEMVKENPFGNISAPGARILSVVTTDIVWLRELKKFLASLEPMMAASEEEYFVSPITPIDVNGEPLKGDLDGFGDDEAEGDLS